MCVCVFVASAHIVIGVEHTSDVFSKVTVKNSLDVVTMVNCNAIMYVKHTSLSLSLSLSPSLSLTHTHMYVCIQLVQCEHIAYHTCMYMYMYMYGERHTAKHSQNSQ